jgi:hypothetical protein
MLHRAYVPNKLRLTAHLSPRVSVATGAYAEYRNVHVVYCVQDRPSGQSIQIGTNRPRQRVCTLI